MNKFNIKKSLRILFTLFCLYVFIAKIYAIAYHIINHLSDLVVYFVDLMAIVCSIILPFLFWRKIKKIKYGIIWVLFLIVSIFLQIFIGLLNYLSKDSRIDQTEIFWTFDIPNVLSILIMMLSVVEILRYKKL